MTSAPGFTFGIVLPDDSLCVLYVPNVEAAVIRASDGDRSDEAAPSTNVSGQRLPCRAPA
jgi:hypothetical protein